MSAGDSPAESPKKSRRWPFIAIVVAIGVALSGFMVYATIQGNCGLACGPAIDVPVILGALVNQSMVVTAPANCGIVTQGYPQAVVCQVDPPPDTSGTITLNMTSQNGDSQVAFGLFSSSQYIQFKSTYSCIYSSNQPDYNALRCPVPGSGSTYGFDYMVSQNLSLHSQIEAVLTIVVTKTCCWP
jgi:hypothetical protein